MNFAPFNVLEFDGAFPQSTIASWLPTFTQPGRLTIYAAGTTLVMVPIVSPIRSIPKVPDPWRATSSWSGPTPNKGTAVRSPAPIVSSPFTFRYQAPPAPPSNAGYTIKSVPDPWRATSTPLYGPQTRFVLTPFLSWQPVIVQPARPVLRAAGTDHVKDVWRFPEAVSADKWLANYVQPVRSVVYAKGTDFAISPLPLIFADRWQPIIIQPNRPISRASGTDLVLGSELVTADKWMSSWIQPARPVVRPINVGTDFVIGPIMPFDLLVPLSQAVISITGTTSLSSTDFGRMHVCTGTSSNYTVTLPSPTGNTGNFIGFIMGSGLTKLVTIAQNASEKIDGANSRVMWANEVAVLYCDGTNWAKVYGKSIPMSCRLYQGVAQIVATGTGPAVNYDTVSSDNTGLMADTGNNRIKVVRSASYSSQANTVFNGSYTATNTQLSIVRNGTGEITEILVPYTSSGPSLGVSTISSCAAGDLYTASVFQNSGGNVTLYTGNANTFIVVEEIVGW